MPDTRNTAHADVIIPANGDAGSPVFCNGTNAKQSQFNHKQQPI